MTEQITIRPVTYAEAIAPIQAIRRQVFHVEQGIPAELEFDGEDDTATHFLAYVGPECVGTARIRYLKPHPPQSPLTKEGSSDPPPWLSQSMSVERRGCRGDIAKIERVAVLQDYRGRSIGKKLMAVAIAHLQQQGITAIKINSQAHAQEFYEHIGFRSLGSIFQEAGIDHIEMWYEGEYAS